MFFFSSKNNTITDRNKSWDIALSVGWINMFELVPQAFVRRVMWCFCDVSEGITGLHHCLLYRACLVQMWSRLSVLMAEQIALIKTTKSASSIKLHQLVPLSRETKKIIVCKLSDEEIGTNLLLKVKESAEITLYQLRLGQSHYNSFFLFFILNDGVKWNLVIMHA